MPPSKSLQTVTRLITVAIVAGLIVFVGCITWQDSFGPSASDFGQAGIPANLETPPWAARNPAWSGVIVFLVTLSAGRVLIFMHRVEAALRRS